MYSLVPSIRAAALGVAAGLSLSGCYTTKMYSANATASRTERTAIVHSFVFGIVPMNQVNLDSLCGEQGFAELKTSINGWGLVASAVTMGLWTPITVKGRCAE